MNFLRAALAAGLLAGALAAHAGANVAFVADIHGNATIEGDGMLAFLAELAPGTRLYLGSGATVCVTYAATGAEYTAVGPGEYLVTPTELKQEKGAAPTRRTVTSLPDPGVVTRVSQAATASLRMRGVAAPAAGATLQYPVDTRVASLQPPLRWQALPGEAVTVTVRDEQGREVWKGMPSTPSEARPGVKLSPDTRYTWTLMTPRGPVAEARFETLPAGALARAEKSRTGAKRFSERVMHALLLQELGAAQDARAAWAALARERPDLPELAALAR